MSTTPRVWFVTGTSSGLGKAIVETVLASGEYIAATSRNASGLSKLQEKYPKQLLPVELDLTSQEDVASALRRIVQHFGRIDVVVNNAGTVVFGEVESVPLADARYLFEVQFWGPVFVMREVKCHLLLGGCSYSMLLDRLPGYFESKKQEVVSLISAHQVVIAQIR